MCAADVTHTSTKFPRNYLRFSQLFPFKLLAKRVVLLPQKSRFLFAVIATASSYAIGEAGGFVSPEKTIMICNYRNGIVLRYW